METETYRSLSEIVSAASLTRQGVRDLNFTVVKEREGRYVIKAANGNSRITCDHPPGCGVAVDMICVVDSEGEDCFVDLLECADCGHELGPETKYDRYPRGRDARPRQGRKIGDDPCLLVEPWLLARLTSKLSVPDQDDYVITQAA